MEEIWRKRYQELSIRFLSTSATFYLQNIDSQCAADKFKITEKISGPILQKMEEFERSEGMSERGITSVKLSKTFGTNSKYLTWSIHKYRGMDFKTYIGRLRIYYITKKLFTQKKYLSYTIDGLAEECGMASRNSLSKRFYEVNGLPLTCFIKLRQQDLYPAKNS